MDSYKRLERSYMFEEHTSIREQHIKIREEMEEVEAEVIIHPESDVPYFKNRDGVSSYVNELLDLKLTVNNQLLRLEREYGTQFMKQCMKEWDNKLIEYKAKKYKKDV